jgi:hypothetical protein
VVEIAVVAEVAVVEDEEEDEEGLVIETAVEVVTLAAVVVVVEEEVEVGLVIEVDLVVVVVDVGLVTVVVDVDLVTVVADVVEEEVEIPAVTLELVEQPLSKARRSVSTERSPQDELGKYVWFIRRLLLLVSRYNPHRYI